MIEFIYSVFILSGVIKGILLYYNIHILDITFLSSLFLTIYALKSLIKNKFILRLNKEQIQLSILFILFYLTILFSLFYTSSTSYCYIKTYLFILNLIALFIPLLIKDFNYYKVLNYFVLLLIVISIIFIIIYPEILIAKRSVIGDTLKSIYLNIGYVLGIGTIFIVFDKPLISKWTPVLLLLFGALVFSGARGPLIFTIIVIVLIPLIIRFYKLKSIISKIYFFFSSIFIIFAFFFLFDYKIESLNSFFDLFQHSIDRLSILFQSNQGNSINERYKFMEFALSKINDNIFLGYGIGSFGWEYFRDDARHYPHNILLEIWFELGLVALLIFLFISFHMLKIAFSKKNIPLIAIYIYLLLNAMKSNTLTDLRILFAIMSFILLHNNKKGLNNE